MTDPILTSDPCERDGLAKLAAVCVTVLALLALATHGPSDAGASTPQSFAEWYAEPANAEWYHFVEWLEADPRNRSWWAIDQHFGDDATLLRQARRVASCESRLNPHAVSPTGDHGTFQINRRSWERHWPKVTGLAWSQVYNPNANARFARWLWEQSGWQPWACRGAA